MKALLGAVSDIKFSNQSINQT